jgi:hypothetical protein
VKFVRGTQGSLVNVDHIVSLDKKHRATLTTGSTVAIDERDAARPPFIKRKKKRAT